MARHVSWREVSHDGTLTRLAFDNLTAEFSFQYHAVSPSYPWAPGLVQWITYARVAHDEMCGWSHHRVRSVLLNPFADWSEHF